MNTNLALSIDSVTLVQHLKDRNAQLYNDFIKVYKKVEPILNTRISQVFQNYTLHNVEHSLRIMGYMEKLLPDITQLSDLELSLLIYSALLHDIGMAASRQEINQIKDGTLKYNEIEYSAILKKFEGNELRATEDLIRRVHAFRSSEYVKQNLKDDLIIPNMPSTTFEDIVALICQSHTEDTTWITSNLNVYGMKGPYVYNAQFCAVILRLADILDFDSQRTPPKLFDVIAPEGISNEEWTQHFSIENSDKIKCTQDNYKKIELHGRCNNHYIHRKILSYIGWINEEIENASSLTQDFPAQYKLLFHPKVYDFIKSDGYTIADMKFNVNYNQITKMLMGEELYGEKKHGLRELIQNALDACKVKKEILDQKASFEDEEYIPTIKIILDKEANEVIIKDDGIGMDIGILKKYFLKLGASFYKSDDYLLKGYSYKPIGNYGIGFLACFMLSDTVTVKTNHLFSSHLYTVELNKTDEFVCIDDSRSTQHQGTEVILKYDQFIQCWEDLDDLKNFLKNHFLTDNINLQYINKFEKEKIQISNPLYSTPSKQSIDLSNYLNGITGQINLDRDINHLLNEGFEKISFYGDPFIYTKNELQEVDNLDTVINISDYLFDDKLSIINVPIIEYGDDLEKFIDFTESTTEGLEEYINRFGPYTLTILLTPELEGKLVEGAREPKDQILPGLKVSDLEDFDHDSSASTLVSHDTISIFRLHDYNTLLQFIPGISNRYYKEDTQFFIRDIFVKKVDLTLPNRLYNLFITPSKINIISDQVVANVTRNDLNQDILEDIMKAIYQAICFYLFEHLNDDLAKETIMGFIKKYHGTENIFLKEKYNTILR
ncbi:HD domain-containing protein [Bacillus anthracis]|uniref:HD domain-containing protein n=1 Tax=Bacillus anthracis TaxID=1392 RepID=UPI0015D47EFF|nr:ATP-binding protein [Bacillus anthracis]